MDYKTILYTKDENVATITLNQPDKRNAISVQVGKELVDCLYRCNEDSNVRAIIFTGTGKSFCSGGDLASATELADSPLLATKMLLNAALPAISELRRVGKPVIAAVNGPATGGGFAFALACDIIFAAKNASKFNAQWVRIGISPDAAMTYVLPRLLGVKRATWYMFTGDWIDAQKGYELGFVNQVVEDSELMAEVNKFAKRLATGPTLAIAKIKELINVSLNESMETQMENEKQAIALMAATEDSKEAISAFLNKRTPIFKGR